MPPPPNVGRVVLVDGSETGWPERMSEVEAELPEGGSYYLQQG